MANFLVTGVAGFIGSSLAHALLDRGHAVRGLDNFSNGKIENIAEIRDKIDFREADLLDLDAMHDACRDIDYVLHQAALGSVPRSLHDPACSNASNVDGTLNILVAARDAKVKRLTYSSSSSLYGNTPTLPKHEGMVPNPISPYAVSKLSAEYYTRVFYPSYGLETVALRYFNVFGPRQNSTSQYSAVLALFITKMLRGEQPTIFGDGETTRDFTYVENVIAANLLACEAPAEGVAGKFFNIANGRRVSLNYTYSVLQKLTGFDKPALHGPERAGDVKHALADISLAEKHLGYKTLVAFEEGLARTVAWYKSVGSAAGVPTLK
jgi:nucleoside-diphosphate-sugar epimerase